MVSLRIKSQASSIRKTLKVASLVGSVLSEALGTDLSLLIPRREELTPSVKQIVLAPAMVKQIREAANNEAGAVKVLTRFASKLKAAIEIDSPVRKDHDQRKARRKG
jgi:hypothetical protein